MNKAQVDSTKRQDNCLKIPVVVGVTGHIDINEHESNILNQLDTFWENVRTLVGKETPLVLLSSIAAGADHYVVKSAYKNGIKYCVVLPFEQTEYEKGFNKTSLQDFKQDLKGSFKVIQCGAAVGDYAAASDYVRNHSDILITLWDGYESLDANNKPKRAGTYHQIRTAFDMDDILIHHQEKAHLVVNLTVSRKSGHQENEHQVCTFPEASKLNVVKWSDKNYTTEPLEEWIASFFAKESSMKPQLGYWQRIKTFFRHTMFEKGFEDGDNIDIETVLHRIRNHNRLELKPLPNDKRNYLYSSLNKFPNDFAIIKDDFIRHEYFDNCAVIHQEAYKGQFRQIARLSVIVGILGQAWGNIFFSNNKGTHELIMHLVLLGFLIGCICLFVLGEKISRQNEYVQYVQPRVIAELMRLKMFWKLAGIQESFVGFILNDCANYWVALPVCNWDVWDAPSSIPNNQILPQNTISQAVITCWLEDQKKYYNSYLLTDSKHFICTQKGDGCKNEVFLSRKWQQKYFKKYERLNGYFTLLKKTVTIGCFILAFLLVLACFVSRFTGGNYYDYLGLWRYRAFIISICPFIVAILGWLLEKNNWDSLGKQYRNMLQLFDKIIQTVNDQNVSPDDKKRAIKELMLFCHHENTEWKNIKNNSKPTPMM